MYLLCSFGRIGPHQSVFFLILLQKEKMKKISFYIAIFSLTIAFSFSSCNSNHFQKNIRFDNQNWKKFNELKYEIPVEAGKTYDFTGTFITDTTFNRRKLEIGFYLYLPSGEERLSDLEFRILDFEYKALGEKTNEGIKNHLVFKENLPIAKSGKLKLNIVLNSQYYDNYGIVGLDLFVKEK